MNRNRVHLSHDLDTAKQVGSRHGKAIVLIVDCKTMIKEDIKFYQSENGVWLTEFVDPKFVKVLMVNDIKVFQLHKKHMKTEL